MRMPSRSLVFFSNEASQLSRVSPRMPEKRVAKVRTFQESCLVVSRMNRAAVSSLTHR